MRRVTAGQYKDFPERFVPVFERHPELFERVRELMDHGLNLLEDDDYGSRPDPKRVERLTSEQARGELPLSALHTAQHELELEHLKWSIAAKALELASERGPAALMLRADEVVDLDDARSAVSCLLNQMQALKKWVDEASGAHSVELSVAHERTRNELARLLATGELSETLNDSNKPLREALMMVLERLTQSAKLDELACLVGGLLPPDPDLMNGLHNLLDDPSTLAVRQMDGTYVPAGRALMGVKLRMIPFPNEVREGVVALERHLPEFLLTPARDTFSLLDATDRDLLQAVFEMGEAGTVADIGHWFRAQQFEPGDDLVMTVVDFNERSFRLERVRHAERDHERITEVGVQLCDLMVELLANNAARQAYVHDVLPSAWAALPAVKQCASEPLNILLLEDGRMELIEDSILRLLI